MERSYSASTFEDAFAQVKRDLGADAVVISSRILEASRVSAASSARVEVTALSARDAEREGLVGRGKGRSQGWLERRLGSSGVPHANVRSLLARIEGSPRASSIDMQSSLAAALADEMVFARVSPTRGARVVALVGPTGVGKTTTIAKLGAIAELVEHRRVALVSIDDYRVGGAAQLESYAELIGVPFEVARDADSLGRALSRLDWADLVLIDTTGRSPRSPRGIADTAETLRGAGEPIEIHLCMALGARDAEVENVIDGYAVAEPTKLVLTKLDEAVEYGPIVFAQARSGLPLSYFCTGQRVPEDLEPASAIRLAALLCGKDIEA